MVSGILGTLGRLGGRLIGKVGSKLSRVGGKTFKYSRLGTSRTGLLGSRAGIGAIGRSRVGLSKLSMGSIKSRLKQGGSRFLTKARQGLKGAWRKIEVDPIGSATAAYSATRNPQVTLTIDGLENKVSGQVDTIPNFASFSSW